MRRRDCFILTLLLVCTNQVNGQQTVSGKEKELSQLQSVIRKVDTDVQRLQRKIKQLMSELKNQEKRYGEAAKIVKSLKSEVIRQQNALREVVGKVVAAREVIAGQKKDLEKLVRAAHAMGRNERIKVILNQQDPALSSRILVYYEYINKSRLQKLHEVEKNLRRLRQLENDRRRQAGQLAVLLAQREREQTELQTVRSKREKLLVKINKQFSSKKSQLARLKINEKKLQQLIIALQRAGDDFPFQEGPSKPFAQLKGRLPWPVKGRLVKRFQSPRSETRWDGVLISAREGVDIHAVTRGRIVYADWLRGYGLLTIIDHGKGYMTLYAFNQSLYKAEGDWVEAGDVIASVGNSGGRSRPGLYFGIRKKGRPVDPVLWCRKLQGGKVG